MERCGQYELNEHLKVDCKTWANDVPRLTKQSKAPRTNYPPQYEQCHGRKNLFDANCTNYDLFCPSMNFQSKFANSDLMRGCALLLTTVGAENATRDNFDYPLANAHLDMNTNR